VWRGDDRGDLCPDPGGGHCNDNRCWSGCS
jgi:hypothetical protein